MNIKKNIFIFASILSIFFSYSQSTEIKKEIDSSKHFVSDYPEGLYITLEDFLNKKHTKDCLFEDFSEKKYTRDCSLKRMYLNIMGDKPILNGQIVDIIFFYKIYDNEKLTNVFAVSFEGNLYIQQKYIHKYANKNDRNEEGDNPNAYHRVIKDGNFFYLEGSFANSWAKGFAYGSGGAVGGVIGSTLNKLKGVVFDFEKKEFNYFKHCEDFNEFLLERNSDEKVECNDKTINILKVREVIDTLIQ
jgi:hypothetical protein